MFWKMYLKQSILRNEDVVKWNVFQMFWIENTTNLYGITSLSKYNKNIFIFVMIIYVRLFSTVQNHFNLWLTRYSSFGLNVSLN